MRTSGLLALLAVASTCGVAAASSYTYDVNDAYANFSVTGTITTNMNIGILSGSAITDWNLTLNDGTATLVLNPGDSGVSIQGAAASVTPLAIYFNFSDPNYSWMVFQNPYPHAASNYLCYNPEGGWCDNNPSSETIQIGSDSVEVDGRTGDEVIATAATSVAPEPGSLALAGTGLLGVLGVIRKRIR